MLYPCIILVRTSGVLNVLAMLATQPRIDKANEMVLQDVNSRLSSRCTPIASSLLSSLSTLLPGRDSFML